MTTWLGLTWIDWLVLSVYLIGVTGVGLWSMSRVNNMADFFMGGRRFGKIFMMFFAFGAGTHSEQAVSVVAGTWRAGLAGIWWQFLWLWATPFYWVVAPLMRRMRALTTSDFFEARFGTSTATLYSIFGMMISITIIGGGLYGSGKMVNALTGGELDQVSEQLNWQIVPQFGRQPMGDSGEQMAWQFGFRNLQGYEIAILAITLLFVTYGLAGGLGAAIITDSIQGVLTIVFSFLLVPWVLMRVGWSLQAGESIKPNMLDLFGRADLAEILGKEPITVFYVVMLSLTGLAGIAVQPHVMGVCGAGKTEMEGRFGFTAGNFIKRFCTIAWTFIGLGCIVWYLGENSPLDTQLRSDLLAVAQTDFPESEEERNALLAEDKAFADELFGRAAYDILPGVMPGLVGLLLASLLASIMSTCDAQMVVASGLFTENIYKRFFRPEATQAHYLAVGRVAALVIVLLSLLLQTTFTDVIAALKVILKTPAAIGISLWFGIAWRRWNTAAVWVSSLTTFGVWWYLATYPDKVAAIPSLGFMMNSNGGVNTAWMIFTYLSMGTLAGIVVSLVTPRTDAEKLDRFFRVMRTPVTPGEEVTEPCTLPANAAPPVPKWFNHPDIELPRPSRTDVVGFLVSWLIVGVIIGTVVVLAQL